MLNSTIIDFENLQFITKEIESLFLFSSFPEFLIAFLFNQSLITKFKLNISKTFTFKKTEISLAENHIYKS